jgi:3-hydroxyisobutyrate dehydrogenase-like beta-hydroxyacid dehydrogenase
MRQVQTIGVVGWGRMGGMIGQYLLARSWPVTAFDPSIEARQALREVGATAAGSASEVAATSDLVLVVVVDDEQVTHATAGAGGVLEAARPGTVVAICASVRPDTCTAMADVAAEIDVAVIDVALVGGERGAEQGALELMCGGPRHVVDACVPAFSAFAIDVCHIGDVGAGQVAKTANNILLWACLRADVEALRLARRLGVQPGTLRAFLNIGSGANRALAEWGMHRLRWPRKDLEVALAVADEVGVDMPFVKALAPLMEELSVDDLADLR